VAKKVKTYDPKKVISNFSGFPIQGYAEGTFIAVSTDGDGVTGLVGCDQEIVRTIDPGNVLKTVTFTLLQSSDTNDLLSAVADRDNQRGDGVGPLLIADLSGRTLLSAAHAWIVKKPDFSRGRTVADGACEWALQCVVDDEAYHIGGHS
jgi:hypothetical protein